MVAIFPLAATLVRSKCRLSIEGVGAMSAGDDEFRMNLTKYTQLPVHQTVSISRWAVGANSQRHAPPCGAPLLGLGRGGGSRPALLQRSPYKDLRCALLRRKRPLALAFPPVLAVY